MPTRFPSARHQAALGTPTGYRRFMRFTAYRGGVSQELEPVGGTLTQDARRAGRWDGSLTFSGDEVIPRRPGDLLTPFGSRIEAEIGLELLDGSVSTVPYGVYEIASSRTSTSPDAQTVSVSLSDISGEIERYRFASPFTVAANTDLGAMVNAVVTNRTGVNPGVSSVGRTLGVARTFGLDTNSAPWSEILDVLDGFGLTAWYDRTGQIQISSNTVDASASYPLDGLTSLSSDFDTQPPNYIVARGESTDDTIPVQAVAFDSDPGSPTYAGTGPGTSPYGRVTEFYSSPLIKTQAQAQSAANTILARNQGGGATYTMTRPFDPTITAGDVVSFSGDTFVVDSATLDLAGSTSLQVRMI